MPTPRQRPLPTPRRNAPAAGQPPSRPASAMAAALRAVRPSLAPHLAQASPHQKQAAKPVPRGTAATRALHDPLATIEQPANTPLPNPLAAALAPLREALQPVADDAPSPQRLATKHAAMPAADNATQDCTSFADLMREQDRKPAPQALLEKLEATASNDSIGPEKIPNKRKIHHTPTPLTEPVAKADFTPPSGNRPGSPQPPAPQTHGLGNLKALHKAMQAQAAEARAQRAQQRSAQQASQALRQAFLQGVGAVTPLASVDRVQHHQPRDPVPMQRLLDEQAVLRESLSDEFDAGSLIDTDERLSFLRPGVNVDVARRLRRGEWTIQKQIDLHGLRTDEAREALGQFIRESHQLGVRCVRVIHGKGLGSPGKAPVLKSRVQRWLVQKAEVMAFVQANPNQGGDGAVVVLLRPSRR